MPTPIECGLLPDKHSGHPAEMPAGQSISASPSPCRAPRTGRSLFYSSCIVALLALAGHAHAGSVSYSYDALGRVVTAVFNNGTSTTTITYSYDAAGNRTSVATTSP